MTPTKVHLVAASISRDCKTAVGVVATATRPGEITHFDLRTGKSKTISSFNDEWVSALDIRTPENVKVRSTEGTVVDAWILKPPSFSPKKKYPAIVEVHGGPLTQYGYSFFHEMQVLAAKGYVVYYSNPRGSLGYGRAFSEAIKYNWGKRDYEDVSAGTDYLESLPYVNKKRIGITGARTAGS